MKIGELAQQTGTEAVTIRFYEQKGLMPPPARTAANYRVYGETHRDRLLFIRHCRGMGLGLDEIDVLLKYRDTPDTSCRQVDQLIEGHIEQVTRQIADLQLLQRQLQTLRQRCDPASNPAKQSGCCGIIQSLGECGAQICQGH